MKDFDFLHQSFDPNHKVKSNSHSQLPTIYIVEDDEMLGKTILKYLKKTMGLEAHYFNSPTCCMETLDRMYLGTPIKERTPFCLITDISFSEGSTDGLLLVDILKDKGHQFVSIVMTGFASIETAILATKKGVFHYLTKPFELDVLKGLAIKSMTLKLGYEEEVILKAMPKNENNQGSSVAGILKNEIILSPPKEEDIHYGMIGRSKAMKKVFERIEKVAQSDSTILVQGPSGTGKELVSRAIHHLSGRKNHELVSVNCGAIPAELLESELFGHVKGSFTGAISDRKGRFELADNGTIFLDEIGDMPLLLQVKLLRVLQNREIERVGGSKALPINVRIITATHRNLEKAVQENNFREDLYYRLNVIPIRIPSLSERREDIPLLISYFLNRFVSADGRNGLEFDDDVLEILLTYDWPGNVRELENLIERLVILRGGSTIRISDLPAKFLQHRPDKSLAYSGVVDLPEEGLDLKDTVSKIENSLILQALERTNGNKNQASKLLKMNRTTLIEKMKKKSITLNSFN